MPHSLPISLRAKVMAVCLGLVTLVVGLSLLGIAAEIGRVQNAELSYFQGAAGHLRQALAAHFSHFYAEAQIWALNPDLQGGKQAQAERALNQYMRHQSGYDLLILVDTQGKLVAASTQNFGGKALDVAPLWRRSYAETAWFQAVLAGQTTDDPARGLRGTYVESLGEDPYASETYQQRVRTTGFSTAVRDPRGNLVGVLSLRAGERWVGQGFIDAQQQLQMRGLNDAELTLLDAGGRTLFDLWHSAANSPDAPGPSTAAVALARAGKPAAALLPDQAQKESFCGVQPLAGPQFAGVLGWSVLVQARRGEVLSHLIAWQRWGYGLLSIAVAVGIGVALLFSRSLAAQLHRLAQELSGNMGEVARAAVGIQGSSEQLSRAAAEQATAIQQTSAAMDQVSAMAKKNASNAALSQQSSKGSRQAVEDGQRWMQQVIQAIDAISTSNGAINHQVEEGNRQISDIVRVIAEIGNKTKVINDIVFQTKLLSFNASVEAARAGEHGKGFAVVAEEVGNLARMSGNAAKEITAMLETSTLKVKSIVSQTHARVDTLVAEGRARVEAGTQVAQNCGNSLGNILKLVQQVEGMVEEIASACGQQAQGVTEINRAMGALDQVTQKNSAVAEQASSSSLALTRQSAELSQRIDELRSLVEGQAITSLPDQSHQSEPQPGPLSRRAERLDSFLTPAAAVAPTPPERPWTLSPGPRVAADRGANIPRPVPERRHTAAAPKAAAVAATNRLSTAAGKAAVSPPPSRTATPKRPSKPAASPTRVDPKHRSEALPSQDDPRFRNV